MDTEKETAAISEPVEASSVETVTEPTETKETRETTEKESKPGPKKSLRGHLRDNLRTKTEEPSGVETKEAPKVPEATEPKLQPIIAAPADMNAAEKEAFSKLTPDMQAYISRRQHEMRQHFSRVTGEVGQKEKELGAILEAVRPHQDAYLRRNMPVSQIVANAIAWDQAFQSDPISAAKEYLSHWGIDPAELGQAKTQQPNYLTREEAEALAEEKARGILERQQQEEYSRSSFNAVQSFIKSKPLFQDPGTATQVEAAMAPIVQALKASDPNASAEALLERAYNIVANDPALPFVGLVKSMKVREEAERTKQEAAKAQAASRSISGGPGSGTPQRKVKDIRENLRLRFSGAM